MHAVFYTYFLILVVKGKLATSFKKKTRYVA